MCCIETLHWASGLPAGARVPAGAFGNDCAGVTALESEQLASATLATAKQAPAMSPELGVNFIDTTSLFVNRKEATNDRTALLRAVKCI